MLIQIAHLSEYDVLPHETSIGPFPGFTYNLLNSRAQTSLLTFVPNRFLAARYTEGQKKHISETHFFVDMYNRLAEITILFVTTVL